MTETVAVVIPVFSHFEYAGWAIRSAYAHTPHARLFVLDDHSPDWQPEWIEALAAEFPTLWWHRFGKNGGLTRSWNEGLRQARDSGCATTIVTNSDVLFTPGWTAGLTAALAAGADLVGPVTNAPGHQVKQQVLRHVPDYKVTDDPQALAATASRLAKKYAPDVFTPLRINGFCMAARTAVWWQGAFNETCVFDPKHRMTRNEDELQGRWKKAGRVAAVVPSSFVFHYRGVTRKGATRGREGTGWFRKGKKRKT